MPVAAKEVTLHPGQQTAWESDARFIALIAGTGGGKTWFGPYWLYREIAHAPAGQFMVIAPTYKILMRATVPTLIHAFSETDAEGRFHESKCQYLLPTGGVIYCLSADKPKYLEGGQIDAAWLDEAGQMDRWVWIVIQARLGVKQGRALVTTTPYGMNWLYHEFYRRWLNRDPDYFCVQFPSTMNPAYPKVEADRMRDQLSPAEYSMRYLGEFAQLEGLAYPDFSGCVTPSPVYVPKPGDFRIGGIDPGWSAPFAALTAVRDPDGRLHITREFYRKAVLLREAAQYLDPAATYWADPSATREITELQSYFSGAIQPAINDLRPGIMKVNEFVRDRRLVVPADIAPELISESATYAMNIEKDLPAEKGPHHALDALRYMIMGIEERGHLDIYFLG